MKKPKFEFYTRLNGHTEFLEFLQTIPIKDKQKLLATIATIQEHGLFYHLSSISRHLIKNRLNSIIKLRNLSIFELRFSVKSVLKNNALPSDFFDKVLQSYGINNFTDFG